ncbi:ricin-type beta-trefoil lectin domain protein, partial [Streptomyces sp. JV181]
MAGPPVRGVLAALAVTATLLTGLSAAPASAAATATGPITGLAGKCVDVAGGAVANGTAVQLYDCNGTAAQQWTVGADGTIRALGKCLDVASGGTADG